jgi:capsid protein
MNKRLAEKNERLRVELENEILSRRLARIRATAAYDATESTRQRRQPVRETKNEDAIMDMRKRGLACNIGRDLERNFAAARGILHQFRVNVVGSLGKIQVNVDGGQDAADWFNGEWARDCDFRDDLHWSTCCQNVVASCMREGDILSVFDDGALENSGKLLHWEADQVTNLKDDVFQSWPEYKDGMVQENGIVRDRVGKVLGYFATGKRGLSVIDKLEDVTFYPRQTAWLVKNPWRLNQGRGVGSMLTSATNFQDLYEILVKELQSAKVAASLAGKVKRSDAVTDWDDPGSAPEYLPENMGKATTTVDAEAANSSDPTETNYERFEALTGGIMEYLDSKDEFELMDIDRPNVHLAEFIEAVLGHAGASVGLARAYTLLRADSSYTSFRGDMVLSWATFYMMQKWLERSYADRVARRAIAWGMSRGRFSKLPAGWERSISWQWPVMPNVDELKEEMARRMALKNGSTNYAEILGPNWRQLLTAYGEQFNEIVRLGLPLSITESISGNELTALIDNAGE